MKRTILILTACLMLVQSVTANENPIEVGSVNWGRNLDQALKVSGETGQPVFVLFQEVPGCSGCQQFGKTVLTHPQIVQAIETEFLPVLVYNNISGNDRRLLDRFGEPAWNFQVVRFLNATGNDIIPRKDRVWTVGELAERMVETLKVSGRPVPEYLRELTENF